MIITALEEAASHVLQYGEQVALGSLCTNTCACAAQTGLPPHSVSTTYWLQLSCRKRPHLWPQAAPSVKENLLICLFPQGFVHFATIACTAVLWYASVRAYNLSRSLPHSFASLPPGAPPTHSRTSHHWCQHHCATALWNDYWFQPTTTLRKRKEVQVGTSFCCHLYWNWCIMKLWLQVKYSNDSRQ